MSPLILDVALSDERSDPLTGTLADHESTDQEQPRGTKMDQLLLVVIILFSFGAWLLSARHVQTGDAAAAGGIASPFVSVFWALVYLFAFAKAFKTRANTTRLFRACLPLVLISVLTLLSTLWSDQPAITVRRSTELLGTVTLALYFASRLGLRAFVEALALATTIAAFISCVLVILLPSVGLDPDNNFAWSGLFEGKNFLGETMVLGALTMFCLARPIRRTPEAYLLAGLCLSLILLAGSRSGSGAGTATILALFIPILVWSRAKQSRWLAVIASLALVIAVVFGLQSDEILGLLGKDTTLTGRSMLWQLVIDAVSQRPALGYGYAAFWGRDGQAASLVYPYIGWIPGTAHNGFLEVALNCGIIGEIIFVWLLAVALWRASAMFWQGRDLLSGWPLFAMLCIILKNVSDASLLAHGESDWIVFVAAFVYATDAALRSDAETKTASIDVWTPRNRPRSGSHAQVPRFSEAESVGGDRRSHGGS